MAANDKDTLYVDIDDEITTIIDKVRSSSGRIVALVLPKRATVFQSIVNMKLLKRAAESAKKHIVLITTEANLMPLAGAVGLHVAATPQSRPEIPTTAEPAGHDIDDEEITEEDEYTTDNAGNRPIGELARRTGHVIGGASATTDEDMVDLDDEEGADEEVVAGKPKRDRKLHVPNFNRFRIGLFLAIFALIALIAGLYVAMVVLPKGAIAITTNASTVNVNLGLTLDTSAQALDATKMVLPAKSEQQQKTTSQQVATTGEKNTGQTATGSVTMTAVKCGGNPFGKLPTVPSGVGISKNGLIYMTQVETTFTTAGAFTDSKGCYNYPSNGSTAILAIAPGAKYNISFTNASVAGVTSNDPNATSTSATATGSASGGTDQIIKVVAQADIDAAKEKLTTQDTEAVKATLEQALRTDGMYPLVATFNAGDPIVTTSNNVGDQADTLTVTQAVTYTMLGVKKADLDTLITNNVSGQINTKDQTILDDGLGGLTMTVNNTTGTAQQVSLQTVATVGPSIDPAQIKKQAAGKRIGDVKSMVNAIPGVTNVDVRLSPFWVSTVPSDPTKVTVTIDKH